ncbi:hypothetical protein H0H93_010594 [Arthromyces matolae]|nr:hypothetical protein H0H93_010594 [Arthromyces matolae]
MRPRQVAFAEDCKIVLGASDHGVIYVFDRKSGKEIDQLRTGSRRILAITAMERDDVQYISSVTDEGDDSPTNIVIWKKNRRGVTHFALTSKQLAWLAVLVVVGIVVQVGYLSWGSMYLQMKMERMTGMTGMTNGTMFIPSPW